MILFLFWLNNSIVYGQELNNNDNALETKVSIRAEQKSIEQILLSLEESNSFTFSYINSEIPLQKITSVFSEQNKVSEVLDTIFKNTLVDYIGFEDQIVLIKKDDIEFLEKVKETNEIGIYYLPSISEYDTEIKNKGNFVNLDKLLKTIIAFYKKSDKQQIYESINDSLFIQEEDSLAIRRKKNKIKKLKFPHISFKDLNVTYGISTRASMVFWTFKSDQEKQDFNKNSIPDLSLSAGGDVYFQNEDVVASIGVRFSTIQKTGIHTDYLINTVFPDTTLTNSFSYNENFTFLEIPFKIGFKTSRNKTNFFVQTGVTLERILHSKVSKTNRIYQNQYFTNLNENSSNNPDLSPYFDQNFSPIFAQETSLRKWNILTSVSLKIISKLNDQWKFIIGPEIRYSVFSLYSNDAPLSQHRIEAGVSIIFSPIFPYM